MDGHARVRSVLRHVYSAAADDARWPEALERLADDLHGAVAGFLYRVGSAGRVRSAQFVRLDPALQNALSNHYATRNPWTRLTQPRYRPGHAIATDEFLPCAELRRTEFHDGILKPMGLLHAAGACVFRRDEDVLSFTIVRSPAQGPYQPSELRRVEAMLPHLRRAVQVNERLSHLQRTHIALADGLEHVRHGIVLVGHRGRVVFANRAARAIVAQQDGLTIAADGLTAAALPERLRLRALLHDAVKTTQDEGCSPGGAIAVTRPSLKRSFLVLVAPLPLALDAGQQPSGLATVFITDPEVQEDTPDETARRVWGLSARETRVAHALASTGSLERAADALSISRETARWHLKQIYRKSGLHRQTALVRWMLDARHVSASARR